MKQSGAMTVNSTASGDAAISKLAAEWKARVDAGLSGAEKVQLDSWLEDDPRHRAAFARYATVWNEFDRPFQAGITDQLMEALQVRARRRRLRRRVITAVSGLLVIFAAGAVWRLGDEFPAIDSDRSVARAPLPASAVLLMPDRQTLPDGSVVELKEGAEIAVDFTAARRRIELRRGEAHFQVKSDVTRPFVVAAGGFEARAVGTAFAVQVGAATVEVLVTEGKVAVAQSAPPASSAASRAIPQSEPLATLGASHRIVVERAPQSIAPPQVTTVHSAELDERLAWRAPRVEFTRTSLADAVAVLNGYSAGRRPAGEQSVHFVIADAATAAVRVSGLFRADRTEAFLSLLKNGLGIDADHRGNGEILLKILAEPKS